MAAVKATPPSAALGVNPGTTGCGRRVEEILFQCLSCFHSFPEACFGTALAELLQPLGCTL